MNENDVLFAIVFRLDSLISALLKKEVLSEEDLREAWDLMLTEIEVEMESEIEDLS